MEPHIRHIFKYFAIFSYAPTLQEIYLFSPNVLSIESLTTFLKSAAEKGSVIQHKRFHEYNFANYPDNSGFRYTGGEYKNSNFTHKILQTPEKMSVAMRCISVLQIFPQIKLIGISGSVAMRNASVGDDIDLFVITSKKRLWTGRFICLVVASCLNVRRIRKSKHVKNKICLNLFFDESDLKLPEKKQTEYGGHEVLQMKPVVIKNNMYYRFLKANDWVGEHFPNAKKYIETSGLSIGTDHSESIVYLSEIPKKFLEILANGAEVLLKNIQLKIINQHKTREVVTGTQLWFFPDDFEEVFYR